MSQRDKPRLSLNNFTAGVREREDAHRTREAGNRDEVEDVVANTVNLFRNGAVGFLDWLERDRRPVVSSNENKMSRRERGRACRRIDELDL
jgi:hypothetical protein